MIGFNTSNKRYFLKNGDRKEFYMRKKAKIYSILKLLKNSKKISVFKNCSSGIWGWGFFQH